MSRSQIYQQIFAEQIKGNLASIGVDNPKMIVITYSGGIGSGKSTITKELVKRYSPLVVNNDEIRSIISKITKENDLETIQKILFSYFELFLRQKLYSSPNKMIILDSSIDRRYPLVNKEYTDKGYKLFIVHINHPKDLLLERIIKRDKVNAKRHLRILDSALKDTEAFLKIRTPNYVITEQNQDDYTSLFKAIENF
jgi:dephospho-CoA kinase